MDYYIISLWYEKLMQAAASFMQSADNPDSYTIPAGIYFSIYLFTVKSLKMVEMNLHFGSSLQSSSFTKYNCSC